MGKKAVVIGAGYGGLASAALLSRDGFDVTVVEKNEGPGGRGRMWRSRGFSFDMGPSWYLMPEVFDEFFALFGKKREDYYTLLRLDPYYRVFFSPEEKVDISADRASVRAIFDRFEPDGGKRLETYLEMARYKYDVAMKEFLYKEYTNLFRFFNFRIATQGLKMDIFVSLDRFVRKFFKDRRARQILEYAMVFLGASPDNAPALYSIMSHVDLNLGVWYPEGGLNAVALGMEKLCRELGVTFRYDTPATGYRFEGKRIAAVTIHGGEIPCDTVIANADGFHADRELLPPQKAARSRRWWDTRVVAPSMFILYLGIEGKVPELVHHNLYFQQDWSDHFDAIFKHPRWPDDPCFYLSCPSKTEKGVAPDGMENLFVLVPVAPGLDDSDAVRESYAARVMDQIERVTHMRIRDRIKVKRIYSHRDFAADYNAFKGTALGLAHTLGQTAVFRPAARSPKVPNLFYAGQYPHPGVGVPMTLISARVAAGAATGKPL